MRSISVGHFAWLPGYLKARLARNGGGLVKRVWVLFADHFEPGWHNADQSLALERVRRWTGQWPVVAGRYTDSLGRHPPYTFFYPEEQYQPDLLDELSVLRARALGDVEVHLHHERDTPQQFTDRVGSFTERLAQRHGLLRTHEGRVRFGFIHGNWALDNSLPDGRYCGLNNEITLLRDLGCYADFTLPSAPSRAQTRMAGTIYWATDDPSAPKSHDVGIPLEPGGGVEGDLLMIPGPLTINLREWSRPSVPRLERGELAGNCHPTRHRARLWMRASPRLHGDVFIKLFSHGAPEKNALPLLEAGGMLDSTLRFLVSEALEQGAEIFFVTAWQMWSAIDAIRRRSDPVAAVRALEASPQVTSGVSA